LPSANRYQKVPVVDPPKWFELFKTFMGRRTVRDPYPNNGLNFVNDWNGLNKSDATH
jgi:hypothetical protein